MPAVSNPTSVAPAGLARWAERFELAAGQHRIPAMEGLRGLAIMLVFWVHFDALFSPFLPPAGGARRVTHWLAALLPLSMLLTIVVGAVMFLVVERPLSLQPRTRAVRPAAVPRLCG